MIHFILGFSICKSSIGVPRVDDYGNLHMPSPRDPTDGRCLAQDAVAETHILMEEKRGRAAVGFPALRYHHHWNKRRQLNKHQNVEVT